MRQAVVDQASQPIFNLHRKHVNGHFNLNQGLGELVTDSSWPKPVSKHTRNGTFFYSQVCNNNGGAAWLTPLIVGRTVTISAWVNTPLNFIRCPRRQQGTGVSSYHSVNLTTIPNVWTLVSRTVQIEAAATGYQLDLGYEAADNGGTTFSFLIRDAMVVVDSSPPSYVADGSTPGWKWLGTANASESVGYPYTLESIAGMSPLSQRSTPGVSSYTPPDALKGRSLYTVFDVLTNPGIDSQLVASVGVNNNTSLGGAGVIAHRIAVTGAVPPTRVMTRAQSLTGVTAFHTSHSAVDLTPGRHVGCSWMKEGDVGFGTIADNSNEIHGTQSPAGGVPLGYLALGAVQSSVSPVTAILFPIEHNSITRRRVVAWLARKYGAPIPAGY